MSAPPPTEADRVLLRDIADLDNPIGYKGNYIIFPVKKALYLTTFMLKEFISEHTGVRDPDAYGDFDFAHFDDYWKPFLGGQGPAGGYLASRSATQQDTIREELRTRLTPSPDGSIHLKARAWAVRGTKPPPGG